MAAPDGVPTTPDRTLDFGQVLEEELDAINRRRNGAFSEEQKSSAAAAAPTSGRKKGAEEEERLRRVRKEALDKHLFGLAFSGGGIRSATFAVGILQGLAKLGLLRRIDYLSTVSGGGYAGSWLATWLKREGSVTNVEKQLARSRVTNSKADRGEFLKPNEVVDEEPQPIYHLRANSRFLAPRSGFLTADTWSIIATYVRNVSINLLMLLPAAMVVVLLVRALTSVFQVAEPDSLYDPNSWILVLAFFMIGTYGLFRGLRTNAEAVFDLRRVALTGHARGKAPVDKKAMLRDVVVPLAVAVVHLPLALMGIFWWLLPEMLRRMSPEGAGAPTVPWFWAHPSVVRAGWAVLRHREILLAIGLVALAGFGWYRNWSQWKLVVFAVIVPLALSLLSTLIYEVNDPQASVAAVWPWYWNYLIFAVVFGAILGIAYAWAARRERRLWNPVFLRSAISSGAAGGVLLATVAQVLYEYFRYRPDLLATLAPPACLLVIVASTIFHVAQLHDLVREDEREWWAYFDAHLIIVALAWLITFATILYLPAALLYIRNAYVRTGVLAGLISTWVGTTIAGVLAGKSKQTGSGQGSVRLETIAAVAPPVFLVGLFGLLSVLVSRLVDPVAEGWKARVPSSFDALIQPAPAEITYIFDRASEGWMTSPQAYFDALNRGDLAAITTILLVLAGSLLVVFRVVDVNLFSLNAMYANRIVRCYLGASRLMPTWTKRWKEGRDPCEGGGAPTNVKGEARRANPITGFDLNDDLSLAKFQIETEVGKGYHGPQLLINTSLNLVATEDLAWSDRKSESFVLSPSHCGSKGTGYARVLAAGAPAGAVVDDLTLGRAVAVSGAAVDPNMNFHHSATLSAFLTIFNARLGYWIENPMPLAKEKKPGARTGSPPAGQPAAAESEKPPPWTGRSPRYGGLLVSELLGDTDNKKEFVHLSDGGHFENTGVYELVRRRCRYIVAVDANEDRTAADENLANLVRLVRIDFGIRIQLDTSALKLDDAKLCRSHVVIGSVRYDDVDNGQVPGVIVYIRTSMTGDEPPDILNYASVNREFPYTSSANQFFDESQFESYRALGDHVARVVFEEAKADAERLKPLWKEDGYDREFRRGNKRLFAALRRRWAESMPGQDSRFLESARGYIEVQERLRTEPALNALSLEVYPELTRKPAASVGANPSAVAASIQASAAATPGDEAGRRAELPEAPISHGWWSLFRRWTATGAFHRNWPILRPEFSTEFVRFVETRLGLVPAMPEIAPWPGKHDDEHLALIEEFNREWPKQNFDRRANEEDDEFERRRSGHLASDLGEMVRAAKTLEEQNGQAMAWAIRQKPMPDSGGGATASDLRGIILIFKGSSLHPTPDASSNEHELLLWVRRSHRGIGLATYGMEQEEIERALASKGEELYVRYPRVEDDVVRSMWKRFFSLYDFETEKNVSSEGDVPVRLRYNPPPEAVTVPVVLPAGGAP